MGVSAEDGSLRVKLGVGSVIVTLGGVISTGRSCGVGTFLGALGRGCVGVLGLVGAALALGSGGGDFSSTGVVRSVAVSGVSVGWNGILLGTAFLGRLGAGSLFGIGITDFSIDRFGLDGLATLLGSCFRGSGFVVIVAVSVGGSFAFGLSW